MQRECVEYSSIPLERVEREHDGDASASDCQTLLASPHCDASHEDEGDRIKEEATVCIVDPADLEELKPAGIKPGQRIVDGYIPFVDGLRGLAVLLSMQQQLEYLPGFRAGLFVVDGFFVLSAFLTTRAFERRCHQLLDRRASVLQWTAMLADYFCRRFLRVYPMVITVALVLAFMPADNRMPVYNVDRAYNAFEVLTFKFEARYYVLWTLPLQLAYYFLIPVFVAAVITLRRHWWLLAFPLFVWVTYEGIFETRGHHMPLRPHLPTFVAGSLAAVVHSRLGQWIKAAAFEFSWRQELAARAFELAAMSLLWSLMFHGMIFNWVFENRFGATYDFPFVSVLLSALIVIEALLPSPIARFLDWNFLRYAGKISYSLYLLHPFVIHHHVVMGQPDRYDQLFLNFGGSMLLATVGYWAVEYPSRLAAQRVSKLLARVAAPTSASAA